MQTLIKHEANRWIIHLSDLRGFFLCDMYRYILLEGEYIHGYNLTFVNF